MKGHITSHTPIENPNQPGDWIMSVRCSCGKLSYVDAQCECGKTFNPEKLNWELKERDNHDLWRETNTQEEQL